mmetsp:Transcript_77103/g.198568  ORF Transcript_77103/g.198568 Transcript_77103/m.198568 type:complete len:979 (+) Transcript_77103:82-3018(+)
MPTPAEDGGAPPEQGKGFKGEGKGELALQGKGKGKGFKGGGKMEVREKIVYQRQSRNAGIHTIEIYQPQFYFSQLEMEEFDARPDRYGPSVIGKYTKGIGQIEGRFNSDDEDPVSFAMTATHRLLERIEAKGFNETGRYQPDGVPLNIYNAVGRIDVGTESIVDRSKSMKSYIMDIFERYGDGESNVEGVDQYNACYGGQACGLCTLSWVESDRWDGRYGIACATDISEAHQAFIAFVGAAATATLFFPDAPMAHHSQRASCILHRLDFCKPVGWHDMAPVTDGKYSVECYLEALDTCYGTLRKKLNDREIFKITDYNVFHTGGGYHIVRKAFERLLRCERPDVKGSEKDGIAEQRLHPSCSILKRIGPCHTVSSFLNTASVAMNKMEAGLGKVILVFTYGSGCAASMYQLRMDDIAYFDPIEIWFLKHLYRNAIKVNPWETGHHQVYIETWMKFDYRPFGRKMFGWDVSLLEDDAYYLGEIDKFGRRFYHRGGMKAPPLAKKYNLMVDTAEGRPTRKHWGPMHEEEAVQDKSQEEQWREIEYNMTYDAEADASNYVEVGEFTDTYMKSQKVKIVKPLLDKKASGPQLEPDGLDHSYQIVGTWNRRKPQEMVKNADGSYSFEITLGENRFESFHMMQDGDTTKRIYPYLQDSFKDSPTIGPHDGGYTSQWLLDCRDRVSVPDDQVGMPGDMYLITFRWTKLKELTWTRLEGQTGRFVPSQYFVLGSWADFEPRELQPDSSSRKGWYSMEVQMTSLGIEFSVMMNEDESLGIYPVPVDRADKTASSVAAVGGPDGEGRAHWKVEDGSPGDVYKISFFRDPDDCEPTSMRMDWTKVSNRPVQEPEPAYYIIGPYNKWGAKGFTKMRRLGGNFKTFVGDVPVEEMVLDANSPEKNKFMMPFRILMHKMPSRCIHPNQEKCTQLMEHTVLMDDMGEEQAWHIGIHPADKAKRGDVFTVQLDIAGDGGLAVSWKKKDGAIMAG